MVAMAAHLRLYHGLRVLQQGFGALQLSPEFPLGLDAAAFKVVSHFFQSALKITLGLEKPQAPLSPPKSQQSFTPSGGISALESGATKHAAHSLNQRQTLV